VKKPVLAAVCGALAIALGLSACGSAAPDAAHVGSNTISRSDFESELNAYANNKKFDAYLTANGQPGTGASSGAVSNDFARSTLQTDILFTLVHQAVVSKGLTPLPTTDPSVQSQTISRFDNTGSPDIFNSFPKSFQQRALQQMADLVTLQNALGGGPIDDAKIKAAYDADPRQFATLCASHILLTTEADAQTVLKDLQGGADFGKEAALKSTDQGSVTKSGQLLNDDGSCPNASDFDPDFTKGALAATPGTPTQPVQTQYGWHIILVKSVTVEALDKIQDKVRAKLNRDIQNKAAPEINQLLTDGLNQSISVDPRYGVWDPNQHQILPPGSKPTAATTTVPGATTTPAGATTTAAGATTTAPAAGSTSAPAASSTSAPAASSSTTG
jgi:parvulin-like peptidyl-prolyl isomerase